ncbi:hypothetical protein K8R33_02915 [archaeon]|nr:hypothetical protein [archaeon]
MKKIVFVLMMILSLSLVSALDYWHGDTCDRNDGVDALAEFDKGWLEGAKKVEHYDWVDYDVYVQAKETGVVICEVGFYEKNVVNSWHPGLFSIGVSDASTGNCVDGQTFIQTKAFYMQEGQTEKVSYRIYVDPRFDEEKDYVAHVSCFNHCYTCNPDDFENYGWDLWDIKITDEGTDATQCDNYLIDGKESDFDCGGECSGCLYGQRCVLDSDCLSGNCGSDFLCNADSSSDCPSGTNFCDNGECRNVCPEDEPDAQTCPLGTVLCEDGECREDCDLPSLKDFLILGGIIAAIIVVVGGIVLSKK